MAKVDLLHRRVRRTENENGAVTIIIAVCLGVLLTVAALVIDAGMLYQERRQLQTAVDSASLAAAHELAEGRTAGVEAVADGYVASNAQSAVESVTVTYPAPNQVRVAAKTRRDMFFARAFGNKTEALTADSTAAHGPAGALSDLAPFLVPAEYVFPHVGQINEFAFELGNDRPLPDIGGQGGYFWLCDYDPGGGGTGKFADWIVNGYPGIVSIGAVVNGTGVKDALKGSLSERVSRDPYIIIPVYDATEDMGSNGEYHVVGFAEFVITGFKFQGNPKTISGYFTDGRVAAGAGSGSAGGADYGIQTVWLTD